MVVYIKIKSIGKRRPILDNIPYTIPDNTSSLRELITAIVKMEVETYNSRGVGNSKSEPLQGSNFELLAHVTRLDNMLVPFLSEEEIAAQSTVGKVGFGQLYSDKKADVDKAVATALQGFEDGLVKVVVNETEVTELDARLTISENDVLTFIRMTFLAGRLW